MTNENRRYHHGNLRAALIEAGLAALERGSAAELSLRALAREVGVSANAAYRHFADKDALLAALAAEGFRRFEAAQRQAWAHERERGRAPSAKPGASPTGQAYVRFARAHPGLFRLMFGRPPTANQAPELMQAAVSAFQFLLESSAQAVEAMPGDDRAVAAAVARWSLVHGLSHLLLDGQLDIFGDRVEALITQVLTLNEDALRGQALPVRASRPA